MSSSTVSSRELIHSINNQLAVMIVRAEMLAKENGSEQGMECCQAIKRAASNIHELLQTVLEG
jgi:hypothetical protein